jgi:hypothetical protein
MPTGTCLCGRVRFTIQGMIHNARYCHCSNCRKFSGTAYAAWGLVRTDEFTLSASDPGVTRYHSGGGLRAFCSCCGSPVWFEPDNLPALRGVPLGVIDDLEIGAPTMHVWTKSMVPWVSLSDALPQHDTHP